MEAQANALANLGGSVDIETDKHPAVMRAQAMLDQAKSDLALSEFVVERRLRKTHE